MAYDNLFSKILLNKESVLEKLGFSTDKRNFYQIIEKMKNANYIKSTREKQIPSRSLLSIQKEGFEILDIFGFDSSQIKKKKQTTPQQRATQTRALIKPVPSHCNSAGKLQSDR